MTENEAKEYIRSRICNEKGIQRFCRDNCMHGEKQCAFQMAIKALEEIQQYRAIGTVEDIEKSMQNVSVLLAEHELLKLYQSIGTVEEFKMLKERNTAKKLKHEVCPHCSTNNDKIIKHLGNPQAHKVVFCWNCGQAFET